MSDRQVLLSIGNTRTRLAVATEGQLEPSSVLENTDAGAIADAVVTAAQLDDDSARVLIASVDPELADGVERLIRKRSRPDVELLRFGREIAVPITHTLTDDSTVGQDRLLDAVGAFARARQACVVIDAGTAITVDFVDGQGVFHGGAISPGLRMMARALHEHTSTLPLVDPTSEHAAMSLAIATEQPEPRSEDGPIGAAPFGRKTSEAIAVGVIGAARGLVHHLIDRYAEHYGAYPRVIATGGDAAMLFEDDDLVELIVPDLPLIGMLASLDILAKLEDED